MKTDRYNISNIVRWLLLLLILLVLASITYMNEHNIDKLFLPYCPEGLWHTGLYWAHCSYPPISIAKYTVTYFLYTLISLLIIQLVAPKPKLVATYGMFTILLTYPCIWILMNKFSWIALFCFLSVLLLALTYTYIVKTQLYATKSA